MLFCPAAPAGAQSSHRLYISVGASTASREFGTTQYDDDGVRQFPAREWIPAVSVAVGARVHPRLGIEGSFELQASQTFQWTYTYQSPPTVKEIASDRDVPLLGLFRIMTMPACRHMCVEPVIGAGFTWHRGDSLAIARCGTYMDYRAPCTPVTDGEPQVENGLEPTFATGADFPVRLSPTFVLAPRFRLTMAARRDTLVGDHRHPSSASGFVVTIGVAATWRR